MTGKFDLAKSFNEWYGETEPHHDTDDQFIGMMVAYCEGARAMADDTIFTLRRYATALAGVQSRSMYPDQAYDTVAVALEAYYDDEVFGKK